jgi:hypothetical protein
MAILYHEHTNRVTAHSYRLIENGTTTPMVHLKVEDDDIYIPAYQMGYMIGQIWNEGIADIINALRQGQANANQEYRDSIVKYKDSIGSIVKRTTSGEEVKE